MYLVINKWVTAVKVSNFSGHYLRNRWTLDIGVLGYIGIVWPKEHSPEVSHIPPVTPCIIELAARSKAWVCGRSLAKVAGSNPGGAWMSVCCECCVLSGRGLCKELVARPEESYRQWRVVLCDLQTSSMRRSRPIIRNNRMHTGRRQDGFDTVSSMSCQLPYCLYGCMKEIP